MLVSKNINVPFLNCKDLLLIFAMIICLAGCSGKQAARLESAARLVNVRPDSAYLILREIDYNDLDSDSLKAKYILTKAWTNLSVGRSLITDTLLNDAANYYISVGDTANWIIASQMLSGYDYIKGGTEPALQRLVDMTPRIKNPELLWDTYLHLFELSMDSQKYEEAYAYADWLKNHTNVPEHKLKYATAKGCILHMQNKFDEALQTFDSIMATEIFGNLKSESLKEFYLEYAEILNGAGRSDEAVGVIDNVYGELDSLTGVRKCAIWWTRLNILRIPVK